MWGRSLLRTSLNGNSSDHPGYLRNSVVTIFRCSKTVALADRDTCMKAMAAGCFGRVRSPLLLPTVGSMTGQFMAERHRHLQNKKIKKVFEARLAGLFVFFNLFFALESFSRFCCIHSFASKGSK